MRVQLLVSQWCPSCDSADVVWSRIAAEREFDFSVVDMGTPEGRELVQRLRLKTVPALVVDGELRGVGVQSPEEAREIVAGTPERSGHSAPVGIALAPASRAHLLSAVVWLAIAGGLLALHGGLLPPDGPWPGVLHVFLLGFITPFIAGLAEHMIPRFMERPVRAGPWSWTQWGLLNAGAAVTAIGGWFVGPALAAAGIALATAGLALLTLRLWPALWPAAASASDH